MSSQGHIPEPGVDLHTARVSLLLSDLTLYYISMVERGCLQFSLAEGKRMGTILMERKIGDE